MYFIRHLHLITTYYMYLQVKTLAPILICSMKIFIHIISQGGKGADEAAENRNYLSGRMSDELNEIIRVLQLTTYDEEEWEADQLTVSYFTLLDVIIQFIWIMKFHVILLLLGVEKGSKCHRISNTGSL